MQILIYIYSYFLIIIKSCIAKVIKLFVILKGFATEKVGVLIGFLYKNLGITFT